MSGKLKALAIFSVSLTLGACSSESVEFEGPYAQQFEEAMKQADSDFIRDVLRDGKVSDAEYHEVQSAYLECMHENGSDIEVKGDGGDVRYIVSDSSAFDSADAICGPGNIRLVEPLYIDPLKNPERRTPEEIVAECLVSKGLVDPGYTENDAASDIETDSGPVAKHPDAVAECLTE